MFVFLERGEIRRGGNKGEKMGFSKDRLVFESQLHT